MNAKRYTRLVLLLTGSAVLAVAVLNLLVDPLGAYPQWDLRTFAPERDGLFHRTARAEQARRGTWDMAILGTSRPKIGLPSVHPAYGTNEVCNLSVNAALMSETAVMFDYTLQHNPLRRVLLGLDFAMFRKTRPGQLGFEESRFNANLPLFDYHAKNLLGASAINSSTEFIINRLTHTPLPEGQRRGFYIHPLKPGAIQRAVVDKQFRNLALGEANTRSQTNELQSLRHFLAVAREHHVEVSLAINPIHALQLELMQAGQNWDRFEQWKRDVVQIVAEETEGHATLWDFTGYTGVTAEEVPPAGSTNRMKYYFETSHYTPATGTLMLDRIYGISTNSFGNRLTPANLESHLAALRADRETYVALHAADVEWAHRISRQMQAGRRLSDGTADEE